MPRSPSAGYCVYGQDVPSVRSYENGYANVQGRPRQQAKLRSKMKEQWKVIEGFEAYAVSDQGNVKRILPGRGTHAGRIVKAYVNRPSRAGTGYLKVSLGTKRIAVHRLVAEAFIPNPLGLPEVNHLGPKNDCRASQLEWRTHAGNCSHSMRKDDGVWYIKKYRKWTARYSPEPNKEVHLGYFLTRQEATEARKEAIETLEYRV